MSPKLQDFARSKNDLLDILLQLDDQGCYVATLSGPKTILVINAITALCDLPLDLYTLKDARPLMPKIEVAADDEEF